MTNIREDAEKTSAGRIAAATRVFLQRFYTLHRFLPDYADLRDGLQKAVHRELILAELKGLQAAEDQRRKRCDEILKEVLADVPQNPKT